MRTIRQRAFQKPMMTSSPSFIRSRRTFVYYRHNHLDSARKTQDDEILVMFFSFFFLFVLLIARLTVSWLWRLDGISV